MYDRDIEPCDRATRWAGRSPVVLESAAMRAESMRVVGDLHCLLRRIGHPIAIDAEEPRRNWPAASFAAMHVSGIWETFPLIPQCTYSADPSMKFELQMASDALLQVNHSAPPFTQAASCSGVSGSVRAAPRHARQGHWGRSRPTGLLRRGLRQSPHTHSGLSLRKYNNSFGFLRGKQSEQNTLLWQYFPQRHWYVSNANVPVVGGCPLR